MAIVDPFDSPKEQPAPKGIVDPFETKAAAPAPVLTGCCAYRSIYRAIWCALICRGREVKYSAIPKAMGFVC
jgi:hypothetical protein